MAIAVKSYTSNVTNSNPATVTLPVGTSVNDTILLFYGNDFYLFSNMDTTPSGAASTWTQKTSADDGSNLAHIRAFVGIVTTGGAQTISVTETGSADEEKVLAAYVLTGVDSTNTTDGAAGNTGGGISSSTQVAPSVTPTTNDAFLVAFVCSGGGSSTTGYTSPGSMTEQAEFHDQFYSGVTAFEQLVVSGATGTRTFTAASSTSWAAVSVAMRTAAGGNQVALDGEGNLANDLDGSLNVNRPTSGNTNIASDGDGQLSTSRSVSGNGNVVSGLDGQLGLSRGLNGSANNALDADGNLTVTSDISLTGEGNNALDADGILSISRPLSGESNSASDADGNLTVTSDISLTGEGNNVSDVDGSISISRTLSGVANAALELDGTNFTLSVGLTSEGINASEFDGVVSVSRSLSGAGNIALSTQGNLSVAGLSTDLRDRISGTEPKSLISGQEFTISISGSERGT